MKLWRRAVLGVPPQRVDDLVVLLDTAQQLQVGGPIHVDAPATPEDRRWSYDAVFKQRVITKV